MKQIEDTEIGNVVNSVEKGTRVSAKKQEVKYSN